MSSGLNLPVLAEDGLFAVVVLFLLEDGPCAVDFPAGEGAGGLADVLFGVVADAEAEQLHQFAGIVLVGVALLAAPAVEPDQHGRVVGHLLEQLGEVAQGVLAHQPILAEHEARRSAPWRCWWRNGCARRA